MACEAATAAGNHALSRSSARAASQVAAVVSSAFTNMLAAWCLTAWKVPMVRPNCSRTLAYSTAISRAAQLTPTASADARIRNTVRALRAAPRSTRSPSTVTPRSATDPTLRVVSSESSAVIVTPSARASTMTTSSPAAITSTSASGAPSTAGLSPVTTRSEPIVTLPDRASAPTVLPSASPGSSCARTESGAQRSITTAAATVGRNGPGRQFAALRLEHHRQFGEAESGTTVLLGDRQTRSIRGPCPPTRSPTDGRTRSPASRAPPRGCSAGSAARSRNRPGQCVPR